MNILLVDDHSLFRQGLEMLLMQSESIDKVYHAETGSEAIQIVKQQTDIELVLLDFNLADSLGIDVLVSLKAHDQSIPVAMISGDENPRQIQQSLDLGASGYILKNMDTTKISAAVEKVLAGDIYIPEEVLSKASHESSEQTSNVRQITELARNVIHKQDLSLRANDVEDTPCGLVSAFNNLLDQLHGNQQELQTMAFRDDLTGLYNRRYFLEQLEHSLNQQKRSKQAFALVYLDLDKFKLINDTLGHQAGDDLLIEISERLVKYTREVDVVSRLGGDEFTMILADIKTQKDVESYLNRLLDNLRQPIILEGEKVTPSVSVGAVICSDEIDIKVLMQLADNALYKVKESGRNGVHIHQS